MSSVLNFKTQKAMWAVYLYEKKNGQGTLLNLYEPSIVGVTELIRLGLGGDKVPDTEVSETLAHLMDGGKDIPTLACELIRASAHLSVTGVAGAESVIAQITGRIAEGIQAISAIDAQNVEPKQEATIPLSAVASPVKEKEEL